MTAQVHERLIYNGQSVSMASTPGLPDDSPRIVRAEKSERMGMPSRFGIMLSTACYRGYVGSWEIREDRLYLNGLSGCFSLVGDEPLFADWVSGTLNVPRGELISYIHMGFASLYEEEIHLTVENGVITRTEIIDNRPEVAANRGGFL